jgi:polyisoprenoid-binding protein YceI
MLFRQVFGLTAIFVLTAGGAVLEAAPAAYELDPEHTTVAFLVSHIGYAKVLGRFTSAQGSFVYDEAAGAVEEITVTVAAASITTDHEARDRHVADRDFLNAERFATVTFKAARAERTGEHTFEIAGDLTLLGTTRPLTLQATLNKSADYPIGDRAHVLGVSARGQVRRSEHGMTYGVDNGLVGDEVDVIVELEARRR